MKSDEMIDFCLSKKQYYHNEDIFRIYSFLFYDDHLKIILHCQITKYEYRTKMYFHRSYRTEQDRIKRRRLSKKKWTKYYQKYKKWFIKIEIFIIYF